MCRDVIVQTWWEVFGVPLLFPLSYPTAPHSELLKKHLLVAYSSPLCNILVLLMSHWKMWPCSSSWACLLSDHFLFYYAFICLLTSSSPCCLTAHYLSKSLQMLLQQLKFIPVITRCKQKLAYSALSWFGTQLTLFSFSSCGSRIVPRLCRTDNHVFYVLVVCMTV